MRARRSASTAGESAFDSALRILRRRWKIILASTVLVGGGRLLLLLRSRRSSTRPRRASSSRRTSRRSTNGGSDFIDPEREAATNEALLELPVVATGAARMPRRRHHARAGRRARSRSSPRASPTSSTSRRRRPDPELSARMVNAYGQVVHRLPPHGRAPAHRRGDRRARATRSSELTDDAAGGPGRHSTCASASTSSRPPVRCRRAAPTSCSRPACRPRPPRPKPVRSGILGALLGAILGFALATAARAPRQHGQGRRGRSRTPSGAP